MRIGIDARISSYNSTGISRYLYGFLDALAKVDNEDEIVLFQNWRSPRPLIQHNKIRRRTVFTPPHCIIEEQLLPWELRIKDIDVFHCVDFYAPIHSKTPLIFTAQDLYFLRSPESLSRDSFRFYSKFKDWALRAAHVICSSGHTRQDLIGFTGIPKEQTSVVYPALNPAFQVNISEELIEQVRKFYNIGADPLLYVGTLEPRKNLERVISAYRLASAQTSHDLPELLLVGPRGFQSSRIFNRMPSDQSCGTVRYLGAVPDQELAALYSIASALIYPSLYEGFGLPILEAFQNSTPVVTSNNSSMKEIANGCALLVDPESIESIAEAVVRISTDQDLRNSLSQNGRKRLNDFSWKRSAQQIRKLYSSIG